MNFYEAQERGIDAAEFCKNEAASVLEDVRREKNPKLVEAGRAYHARLRAELGEEGYRALQRERGARQKELHREKLREWGQDGYFVLAAKYGYEVANRIIQGLPPLTPEEKAAKKKAKKSKGRDAE